MARPDGTVLSWNDLQKGQEIRFYASSGWKRGQVSHLYDNSCSIIWSQGANVKTIRIYDLRNLRRVG